MDIKALGYLGIETADPPGWARFATEVVGMMRSPSFADGDDLFLKMDAYPWRVCIRPGKVDRIAYAGWELADGEALQRAREELREAGVELSPRTRFRPDGLHALPFLAGTGG